MKINSITFNLFLDTGNPSASVDLTTESLKKVTVKYTGETQKSFDWRGREYIEKKYILPEVQLGNIMLTNINGTEHKLQSDSDGTISFGLIRKYNVLIDFPHKKMSLYALGYLPDYLKQKKWKQLKARVGPGKGFEIILELDGIDQEFVFGLDNAAIALDNELKAYNLIRLNSPLGEYLSDNNLINPSQDTSIEGTYCSSGFSMNNTHFKNLSFMIVDYKLPLLDGLLGYKFFMEHPIFIDFNNNNLYIK